MARLQEQALIMDIRHFPLPKIKPALLFLSMAPLFLGLAQTATACSFNPPAGWKTSATRWEGECRTGKADGLGVLKLLNQQGEIREVFYGRLSSGEITLGVLVMDGSFSSGYFTNGQVRASEDNTSAIAAGFKEAESASRFVAARFRQAGNTPSALFYEKKARNLQKELLGE